MKKLTYALLLMIFTLSLGLLGGCEDILYAADGTYQGSVSGTGLQGKFRITIAGSNVGGYVQTNHHGTFQIAGSYKNDIVKFSQVGITPEIDFVGVLILPNDISGRFDVGTVSGTFYGSK